MTVTLKDMLHVPAEARRFDFDIVIQLLENRKYHLNEEASKYDERLFANIDYKSTENTFVTSAYIFEYHAWETETREFIKRYKGSNIISNKNRSNGERESDLDHILRNITEINLCYKDEFQRNMDIARKRVGTAKHAILGKNTTDARYSSKEDYFLLNDTIVENWKSISLQLS